MKFMRRGKHRILRFVLAFLLSSIGGALTYAGLLFSPEIVGEHHGWPNIFVFSLYAFVCPIFTLVVLDKKFSHDGYKVSLLLASGALYLSISNIFLHLLLQNKKANLSIRFFGTFCFSLLAYTLVDNLVAGLISPQIVSLRRVLAEFIIYSPTFFYYLAILIGFRLLKNRVQQDENEIFINQQSKKKWEAK